MSFPLQNKVLIMPGGDAKGHLARGLGIGADYEAYYQDLLLPFDGDIYTYSGYQGGRWLRLTRENGDKIEFAHLDKYIIKSGFHKKGTHVAYTGNSGRTTSGPHLHIQVFVNGKRVDPEKYNWNMSNVKIYKKGNEFGIMIPTTTPEALISYGKNFGIDIPHTDDHTVEWDKLKVDFTL